MTAAYTPLFFQTKHYKIQKPFNEYLELNDQIFTSPSGVYINRGKVFECNFSDAVNILASMKGNNPFDIDPFIVFGLDFENSINTSVNIPEQIIYISSSNFVTHFFISTEPNFEWEHNLEWLDHLEPPHHIEISSSSTKEQFLDNVNLALKYIETNEIEKVVLARQLSVTSDQNIDPRRIIGELITSQPQSYVFSINSFVGASPELLVEKNSRSIRSCPMAGTRKRHARLNEDDASIAELQTDNKDLLEHEVVVNDIIQKLEKVASDISSSNSPYVARLPNVVHLTSEITASCDPSLPFSELIYRLHPTPAVGGTPGDKAVQIINDIEPFERELYASPIGWIDSKNNGESAIALRCAKIVDHSARLYAGVGIVKGSDPLEEWEETQTKFGVIRNAIVNLAQ